MTQQAEFTFKAGAAKPDASELVAFLRGKNWLTAAEISEQTKWDDRHVRKLATASDEIISYPGSPGYKLLCDTTAQEYEHYRNARRSQARDMIAKVIRTDRIFYAHPKAELP